MSKPEDLIPDGYYCYTIKSIDKTTGKMKTKICPYWSIRVGKPNQENGYCAYLDWGDWDMESSFTLLWDQVKECGVKFDDGPGRYQLPEE